MISSPQRVGSADHSRHGYGFALEQRLFAVTAFKQTTSLNDDHARRSRARLRVPEKSSPMGQRESSASLNGLLSRGRSSWVLAILGGIALLLALVLLRWLAAEPPARLWNQAEEAAHTGNWNAALRYWRAINATAAAQSSSHLGEARACLALSRANQAKLSLHRAINADPSDLETWRLMLGILWVEDRTLEAQRLGWEAYDRVRPEARRELFAS